MSDENHECSVQDSIDDTGNDPVADVGNVNNNRNMRWFESWCGCGVFKRKMLVPTHPHTDSLCLCIDLFLHFYDDIF